ncbi:probable 6-phosphogluconolactonase [Drosophila ficusphila]|uniref:probable 6-phosphogluconolactonase n=1 Tax=Drosophila ficusphila TaxID=30025 RepID=UPI0007E607C1|nr:probable 6-phosphogluconolactonase [Drosophila ficusphila]
METMAESRDSLSANMSEPSNQVRIVPANSEDKLVLVLADLLVRSSEAALKRQDKFNVGLSGGSLIQLLTKALKWGGLKTEKWVFYFCDERYVPLDDGDSTYGAYKAEWLTNFPGIQDSQFVRADTTKSLDDCATDYETKVKDQVGCGCLPRFDLLLLGMGPDGHTCSLFPEQPASLQESQRLVIPIRNSPKPPPERITFTLPLINNAWSVAFVVTGAGKASVVKSVFVDQDKKYPAAWVKPTDGELMLIVDEGAAKELLA